MFARPGEKTGWNIGKIRGQTGPSWVYQPITNPKTTMKLSLKPLLVSFAVGVALAVTAQGAGATSSGMTTSAASGSAYGLLGQDYMGVHFGYTDVDSGPVSVAHSYGFIANRPSEVPNLDALFKYDFSRARAFGQKNEEHDFAIGAVGYVPLQGVKPFAEANVGWAFGKFAGAKSDSFTYLLGAGVEIQVIPRLVLSPYVNFQEATHYNRNQWTYGVKATYRVAQEWSTSLAVELNKDDDVTVRFGLNRHF